MRFPFSLTWSMARYLCARKIRRTGRFPFVLMLEPLHRCNLCCAGCGRIREYHPFIHQEMTLTECLDAVDECGAPLVSICGGEPMLYRQLPELIEGILDRKKHIYLCTNGLLLKERLPDLLTIRHRSLKRQLFINVHLDGPESVHDAVVERPGVYRTAMNAIIAAKTAGFRVYTNTTVYRPTTVDSLMEMGNELVAASIDGMMISPGFGYESVETESGTRFFMSRSEITTFFQEVRRRMKKYPLTATPDFLDFLTGQTSLTCAAWANPTRNVCGWRSPCYLLGDRHYQTFDELMTQTDWNALGPGNDPRCRDCMTHCGFEPAAVLQTRGIRKLLRMAFWQFFG